MDVRVGVNVPGEGVEKADEMRGKHQYQGKGNRDAHLSGKGVELVRGDLIPGREGGVSLCTRGRGEGGEGGGGGGIRGETWYRRSHEVEKG